MKYTIKQLLEINEPIKKILNSKAPQGKLWDLAVAVQDVTDAYKIYDSRRIELVKQFGEEQEDKSYKITDVEGFNKSFDELLKVELDFNFPKLVRSEVEHVDITPMELHVLIVNEIVLEK